MSSGFTLKPNKMKITKLLLLAFTFTGLLFFKSQTAEATVMSWHTVPTNEYGVRITSASNHGRVEQYRQIFLPHISKGLTEARNRLVEKGKIQDVQVLFTIPSPIFQIIPEQTQISLEADCKLPTGDTGLEPRSIGECYKIHYVGEDSYEDFLTVLASLSTLRAAYIRSVDDIEAEKVLVEDVLSTLQGIKRFFDPVWSPDSKYVVFTAWEDGDVGYSIRNTQNEEVSFVKLVEGYPVDSPIWSPDSKYMAVASLSSVGLYDAEQGSWNEVPLPEIDQEGSGKNSQIFVSFDPAENRLMISRDLNYFANYELLAYDLATSEIKSLAIELYAPMWGDSFDDIDYTRKTRSTSPNGMYEASIKKEYVGKMGVEKAVVGKSALEGEPTSNVVPSTKKYGSSELYHDLFGDPSTILRLLLVVIAASVFAIMLFVSAYLLLRKVYYGTKKEQQSAPQTPFDTPDKK
jgi:hypothetical protein